MNFENLIRSLERFARVLPVITQDVDDMDAKWKPANGAWSILEVVCHLVDEEIEDFRKRVRMGLANPKTPWSPIDPEGVAIERDYNSQVLSESVKRFVNERSASVTWLRSLQSPNWDQAYVHPELGPTYVGEVMASWAAHDHLHLRQITKRLYEMNGRDALPFKTGYAGEWKA